MEPSASGSGLMWHASATCDASFSASAARSSWSPTGLLSGWFLMMDLLQKLLDPAAAHARVVLLELELGRDLHPDLPADNGPKPRRGRAQRCPGRLVIASFAQHRVEHAGLAQVGRHTNTGHGDEAEARVLQPLDLLRQDLAQLLQIGRAACRGRVEIRSVGG